jgi:hypothetical protein
MSSVPHEPGVTREQRPWTAQLLVTEMWASLAIAAMWVVVAVSAVWGPDFVSTNGAGTNSTTIPSGIFVAVLATIGTWAVAKHGLGKREHQ